MLPLVSDSVVRTVHYLEPLVTTFLAVFASVMASSGFWAWMQKRSDKNDVSVKLALGLAHNEIVSQGIAFIERGYVTTEEYQDYVKYLYAPYATFGGNGLAEKVFREVGELPIRRRSDVPIDDEIRKHITVQELKHTDAE